MVTLSPAFLSGQTMGDVNPLSQNLSQLPPAFAGSVPAGKASSTVLELSLHDALDLSLGAADILGAFNQSQVLLQAEIKGIVQREFQDRAAGFAGGNAAGERGRKLAQVLAEWIHITHRLP